MYKKNSLIPTLIIQTFCSIVLMYVAIVSTNAKVWASSLQVVPATPQPFLGPIYYGSKYVYNVFDHWSPCASVCVDPNNDVLHYNGTIYFGVTGTPDATASPTPTHWPSATPYIPDDGYGYDEHAGIDYGLQYVPVLAAADGKVTVANWFNPSNHRASFGLYVQLSHEEHNSYSTLYAHLSVVTVQLDEIVIADPLNRNGIVGISGNTGAVFGCGSSGVEEDPLCGAHLHFETRKGTDYHPMNPYGYISTTTPDPWPANTPYGAVSYLLWATPPAIAGTPQYPVGPTVSAPPAPVGVRIIDNEDPGFKLEGSDEFCPNGFNPGGWNGSYYVMPIQTDTIPECTATWSITPNELTEPDYYDVYVYIPVLPGIPPLSLSRGVYYEIKGASMHTAVVVQAAYPNESHADNWVYIGRYYFTMAGDNEYIKIHNSTFEDDGEGFLVAADAVQLARVNPGQPITPTPTSPPTNTPTLTPTPGPGMVTASVLQSREDAGPYGANISFPGNTGQPCTAEDPSYAVNHKEVYFGRCEDGTAIVSGFHFQTVFIPDGAIITQARLEFTTDGYLASNILDVIFQGELVGDSMPFSEDDRPSNRFPLTNGINWHIAEEWSTRGTVQSPDISSIVQAIVDLPDWVQGDPITIITSPGSAGANHRRVFAWDREQGSVRSAKLLIWYLPANTPTPTPTFTPTPTPSNTGFLSPNASVAGAGGDSNGYESQSYNAYNDGGSSAGDKKSGAGTIMGDPCVSSATDKHIFRDFNITIPTNATIRGIEVRLDAFNSIPSTLPQICVQLSWDGGITWTSGQVTPVLTNSQLTYLLGSATYLWAGVGCRVNLPTAVSG